MGVSGRGRDVSSTKWAVIAGSFTGGDYGGFRLAGPFADLAKANEFVESVPTYEGLVAAVLELEDPGSVTWPD
jgi:hypothetical protein